LFIKYEEEILDEFDIVSISSNVYDLTNDYLYVGTGSLNKNDVTVVNGVSSIDNNKLFIKYEEEILDEIDIVSISSNVYDLTNDYLYVGTGSLNKNDVTVVNGRNVIEDNKLFIKYEEEILDEIDIVSISSNVYDLTNDYLYVGTGSLNKNDVTVVNGRNVIEDNKLFIKYEEEILDEFDIVSISSNVYDLTNDYLYVGTGSLNKNDVTVVNGRNVIEDNKLLIKYDDEIVVEYKLVGFNINNYHVVGNLLVLSFDVPYEDFIQNIVVNDEIITYKIYNGNDEVINGDVSEDMKLIIYCDGNEVDQYVITGDYVYFDERLYVDENAKVIGGITVGNKINNMFGMVDTNGNFNILDRNDNLVSDINSILKTGYKFRVNLPSQTLVYSISVIGDVNGDGKITKDDIELVSNHITKGNLIIGGEYLVAANIDNNNNIDINDIIKMAKSVKNNGDVYG
jgi:hypothetical protein